LNGFTLKGPGVDSNTIGIVVDSGNTVRIKGPGTVTGFGIGVEYHNATGGAMRDIYLTNNDVGVLLDKSRNMHVKQNYISDNRVGVFNRASDNTEVENVQMIRNDKAIQWERSRSVDVDFNIIMDGQVGVYLDSDSVKNEVFYNVMFRNDQTDLVFAGAEGSNDDTNNNFIGNKQCGKSNPASLCSDRAAA
jgi:nitrous oxidase accessory protein NosD